MFPYNPHNRRLLETALGNEPADLVIRDGVLMDVYTGRVVPHQSVAVADKWLHPQDLLAIIRANGGEMKETYGVPVEEIQEGIKHGVRKINIDTDIRLSMTAAIRKYAWNAVQRL